VAATLGGKVLDGVDDLGPGPAARAWRSILAVVVRESGDSASPAGISPLMSPKRRSLQSGDADRFLTNIRSRVIATQQHRHRALTKLTSLIRN
jgi:hypothetical protein